jgi:hypothetical protein
MNECLACESKYERAVSDSTKPAQYCSLLCEAIFESYLELEVERAQVIGLIDSAGEPLLSTESTRASVDKIIRAYSTRKKE